MTGEDFLSYEVHERICGEEFCFPIVQPFRVWRRLKVMKPTDLSASAAPANVLSYFS